MLIMPPLGYCHQVMCAPGKQSALQPKWQTSLVLSDLYGTAYRSAEMTTMCTYPHKHFGSHSLGEQKKRV